MNRNLMDVVNSLQRTGQDNLLQIDRQISDNIGGTVQMSFVLNRVSVIMAVYIQRPGHIDRLMGKYNLFCLQ